jgi:hypothetical protein
MTEVEHVAVWIGLISGVVGIVLAVVAITFTALVNRRADTVNNATIGALTQIQADLGRLGNDVRELIKDAWGTMLHERGPIESPGTVQPARPDELAQGLAAEVRSDMAEAGGGQVTQQVQEALDKFTKRLSEEMGAMVPGPGGTLSMAERMRRVVTTLERRSPEALHLLRRLSRGKHLTRDQYGKLGESDIAPAVGELRRGGLLRPMASGPELVYWIPGEIADLIELGARLVPDPPAEAAKKVDDVLREVGYEVHVDQSGSAEPPSDAGSTPGAGP